MRVKCIAGYVAQLNRDQRAQAYALPGHHLRALRAAGDDDATAEIAAAKASLGTNIYLYKNQLNK